jgi:tRNA(fMet)-specific endonuclease VapC
MNGNILLDTNIVIAIFAGESSVLEKISEHEVLLPNTVLGELYFGAYKSARTEKNLIQIEEFASCVPILNASQETAKQYGKIKTQLHKEGRPIPENDIWIAAYAIEHDLTLITRDEHFYGINGLSIEKW